MDYSQELKDTLATAFNEALKRLEISNEAAFVKLEMELVHARHQRERWFVGAMLAIVLVIGVLMVAEAVMPNAAPGGRGVRRGMAFSRYLLLACFVAIFMAHPGVRTSVSGLVLAAAVVAVGLAIGGWSAASRRADSADGLKD